jgi:hypothetical protein
MSLVAKERAVGPARDDIATAALFVVRKVYVRFSELYFSESDTEVVMVPTDLIGTLRSDAVLLGRTPLLRSALVAKARRLVGSGGWPADLQPRVILMAVAAAMTADVEEETATLGLLNARYTQLFDAHSKALAGAPIQRWGFLQYLQPWNWFTMCCETEHHHQPDAQQLHALAHAGILPEEFKAISLKGLKFRLQSEWKDDAGKPSATCRVTVLSDPNYVEPAQASFKLVLIAMGPMIPAATQQRIVDVVTAFTRRIGRAVPPAQPGAWQEVGQLAFTHGEHEDHLSAWVMDEPIVIDDELMEAWYRRMSFNQQNLFRRAAAEIEAHGILSSDLKAKAFLKLEKSAFLVAGGEIRFTPRLILGYAPKAVVATGPYNWAYAKRVRAKLSVEPGHAAVWVTGREASGTSFGRWYKAAIDSIPPEDLLVIWLDHEKMEAHRHPDFIELDHALVATGDPPADYLKVEEANGMIDAYGMKHPLHLEAEDPNGSGRTATSRDSGARNHFSARKTFGRMSWGLRMYAFNGDDGLLVTRRSWTTLTDDEIHAGMLTLGMEITLARSFSALDAEFCQCLPYPVGGRIVWGPKIGRVLQRLPWQLENANDDPRGVAKGMLISCSHIPFLTDYLHYIVKMVPATVRSVDYEYHLGSDSWLKPDAETWAFVFQRYHMTQNDLVEFMTLLEGSELGTMLSWPRLAELVRIDE